MFSDGKVAIVTGGTRGIGGAITRMLAQAGVKVAAGYSRGKEGAEKLKAELEKGGSGVSIHQGSVHSPQDCERVVKEAIAQWGRVDFLINNAGITIDKTVRRMTDEDWTGVMDVNLSGTFRMTKSVLEHMIAQGSGRIVNISSVIGQTGNIGQANYAASKAGLIGRTSHAMRWCATLPAGASNVSSIRRSRVTVWGAATIWPRSPTSQSWRPCGYQPAVARAPSTI